MRHILLRAALSASAILIASANGYANNIVSDTTLTDMNQNQILVHRPAVSALVLPERKPLTQFFKLAKVHFVVDQSDTIGFDNINQNFDHNDAARCKALGFKLTASCAANQFKSRLCPYDNTYYDRCCHDDYKYTKAECSYPNTISSASCGGKYKCYCDADLYPYTTSNCPAPKELSDKCVDAAGSHYALCSCPSYYKPCNGSNQQGVGAACNRNGETVYAACECQAGYNQVCEQFGPTNPGDYCLNGGKFYKSCKTCPNLGTLERCPIGFACTLEQCSGKFYISGCDTGYSDISACLWKRCWMPAVASPEG